MNGARRRATWPVHVPAPVALSMLVVAVATTVVFLLYHPGDGPILRSIALPLSPVAVALDEQTGRAFVLPSANKDPAYIVNVDTG